VFLCLTQAVTGAAHKTVSSQSPTVFLQVSPIASHHHQLWSDNREGGEEGVTLGLGFLPPPLLAAYCQSFHAILEVAKS
jgi:hypothetical protein